MKKFWNKSATGADIYIYGDIVSHEWYENDTTAAAFAEDLDSFGGEAVNVHVNSGGGDVFAGLAICNCLKNYSGFVTAYIDGLAASAASILVMGANKICAASNALIMLHEASVDLLGLFRAEELQKALNALTAIKSSLVETYSARLKGMDIEKLLADETWFSAQEALSAGLIDEITGEVALQVDDTQQMLFVNSLAISTKKFDAAKMRRALEAKNKVTPIKDKYLASLREKETSRIQALNALRTSDAAVNAILDAAIQNGDTKEKIAPYLAAVQRNRINAAEQIQKTIYDQMTSGAQGVQGSMPPPTEEEMRKAQAKRIADFANGLI